MKENNIYQSCTLIGKQRHSGWVESNICNESHIQQTGNCYVCEHQASSTMSSRTRQRKSFKSLCLIYGIIISIIICQLIVHWLVIVKIKK